MSFLLLLCKYSFEKLSFSFLQLLSTYLGVCARLLCSPASPLASPLLLPSQQISPAGGCSRGTSLGPAGASPGPGKPPASPPFFSARGRERCPSTLGNARAPCAPRGRRNWRREKDLQLGSRAAKPELPGHREKPGGAGFARCLGPRRGPGHH